MPRASESLGESTMLTFLPPAQEELRRFCISDCAVADSEAGMPILAQSASVFGALTLGTLTAPPAPSG